MQVIIDMDGEIKETALPSSPTSQGSAFLNLLYCLGYESNNPPLGDVLSQHHQLEGRWLILSPSCWQASHNDVQVTAFGEHLLWEEAEAQAVFNRFAHHVAEEGLTLFYHDKNTWLLSLKDKPPLNSKPVHQLLHHTLLKVLREGDPTMYWQKFFTQSQMFFATQSDSSLVNGVWAWGGAVLGNKKNTPICADNAFFPTAKICSTAATLYDPEKPLVKRGILLLSDHTLLNEQHHKQLKKIKTIWYWNNGVSITTRLSWLARIWRN